jgi:hypothetical protein
LQLVKDLEKEGYTFVYFQRRFGLEANTTWKHYDKGKEVFNRLQKRAKRKKVVDMSTSDVDNEETTCAQARNAEEFQPRTFRNANTNVFILLLWYFCHRLSGCCLAE